METSRNIRMDITSANLVCNVNISGGELFCVKVRRRAKVDKEGAQIPEQEAYYEGTVPSSARTWRENEEEALACFAALVKGVEKEGLAAMAKWLVGLQAVPSGRKKTSAVSNAVLQEERG